MKLPIFSIQGMDSHASIYIYDKSPVDRKLIYYNPLAWGKESHGIYQNNVLVFKVQRGRQIYTNVSKSIQPQTKWANAAPPPQKIPIKRRTNKKRHQPNKVQWRKHIKVQRASQTPMYLIYPNSKEKGKHSRPHPNIYKKRKNKELGTRNSQSNQIYTLCCI